MFFNDTQRGIKKDGFQNGNPEVPARQIDVSRQKLSPHCLEAILTRSYPRPNCLLKCLPNCLFPTREGFLSSFKINPAVRVIARQVRDKNCLAAIFAPRHQSVSSGPLGSSGDFQNSQFCCTTAILVHVWVFPSLNPASPSVTFGVSFFAVFLGYSLCTKEEDVY